MEGFLKPDYHRRLLMDIHEQHQWYWGWIAIGEEQCTAAATGEEEEVGG